MISSPSLQKIQQVIELLALINEAEKTQSELLKIILEVIHSSTHANSVSVFLQSEEKDQFYFEDMTVQYNSSLVGSVATAGKGIVGWAIQNLRSLIVNGMDERFFSAAATFLGQQAHSIFVSPVQVKTRCRVVFKLIKYQTPSFTNDDREWVDFLANQAGLALLTLEQKNVIAIQSEEDQTQHLTNNSRDPILYKSTVMKNFMEIIKKVAMSDGSVLITGESRVGKELIAQHIIHTLSRPSYFNLVKVNCPSLPDMLLESELFGHVKGAFTDAIRTRREKLEKVYNEATFFDKIADISPEIQAKLLRVLASQKYESLGSNQLKTTDVRVIAASNKSLEPEMKGGRFREDLFYCLNVIPLKVPPLRDQLEDISILADSFLNRICVKKQRILPRIIPESIKLLNVLLFLQMIVFYQTIFCLVKVKSMTIGLLLKDSMIRCLCLRSTLFLPYLLKINGIKARQQVNLRFNEHTYLG